MNFNNNGNNAGYGGQYTSNSTASTNNTSMTDSRGSPMLSPKVGKEE
jgi:hypothetical protein